MKKILIPILLISISAQAQSIVGKWKTIDDETGEARSIVELFEKDGKLFGKVIRIFTKAGEDPDPKCTACPSDDGRYEKKVIGMEIIQNMRPHDDYYADGDILDPENGKIYRCKLWIEDEKLSVRGYWGPFYRTQIWEKAD